MLAHIIGWVYAYQADKKKTKLQARVEHVEGNPATCSEEFRTKICYPPYASS